MIERHGREDIPRTRSLVPGALTTILPGGLSRIDCRACRRRVEYWIDGTFCATGAGARSVGPSVAAYRPNCSHKFEARGMLLILHSGAQKNTAEISLACLDHEKKVEIFYPDHPFKESRTVTHPDNLAYLIYTSGTTGKPKGVMIHQLGMLNHLWAKINDLSITSADIIAQTASPCFDISVWQFLTALLVGGTTFIIDKEILLAPLEFFQVLQLEY